ncbi:MAG: sugar phosphate nucleotidyltransferase [Methanomicrobiales archaeon]|nr:sugar phosphate nucleotidyltransferase [Methanomicrobiales archaeon]
MQAVILAAGEGKRVRPLTRGRPKALLPVGNRPILWYVIDAVVRAGIRDVVVVVGYRKEQVMRFLGSLDLPVRVVVQPHQVGTGDALCCAAHLLTDHFLVLPGDNYIDTASIARVLGETAAVLVKEHPSPSNFGVVLTCGGLVTEILEKPVAAPSFLVSTGVFSLPHEALSCLGSPELTDVVRDYIRTGREVTAVPAGEWADAIYPWDFVALNRLVLSKVHQEVRGEMSREAVIYGNVTIGEGTSIGPFTVISGPVAIGEDCDIGPHVVIGPGVSIGPGCRVGSFTCITDSVVMEGVEVGPFSHLCHAVIGQGTRLGDHTGVVVESRPFPCRGSVVPATFGAVIGDEVRSGPAVTFAQCVVGNSVAIRGHTLVNGDIARKDGSTVV